MNTAQKETLRILSVFPPEDAFRIINRTYVEFTIPFTPCTTQVPSTVIFTSDGIEYACTKLYDVLKTPDLQPTPQDSSEAKAQRELKLLIIRTAFQHQISQVNLAQQCLRAVANKPTEEGRFGKDLAVYKDVARLFPDPAWDWLIDLKHQFNPSQIKITQQNEKHRHFFAILWATQLSATHFLPSQPLSRENLLETIHEAFQKTRETIDLLGVDTLNSLNRKQAAKKFAEYRKYTYSLRGLTL